ncbi:MAG: GGDEF domain-containing protein [Sulfuricurvum sp.]|uniref:GGDEF domain-containing protein n=1 Tax=Sulfuricurvum sp. TaxID=2025608 RepID=UPI003563FA27
MKNLVEKHSRITNEVKKRIEPISIVFPIQYNEIYSEIAHSYEINLQSDQLLSHEMLDEKIVRHITTFSECTTVAIHAMKHGDVELLEQTVLKTERLQEELQELRKIIYEDSLTQSYNRKWFEDELLDLSRLRLRDSGTLVMIDLNKFKKINDTYGHVIGDQVLSSVAKKLRETGGRVVRYGGDEFIVIFDQSLPLLDVKEKMELILRYFQKIRFMIGEYSFNIDFAFGMASFSPNAEVLQVIELADKAMYRHKKGKT